MTIFSAMFIINLIILYILIYVIVFYISVAVEKYATKGAAPPSDFTFKSPIVIIITLFILYFAKVIYQITLCIYNNGAEDPFSIWWDGCLSKREYELQKNA